MSDEKLKVLKIQLNNKTKKYTVTLSDDSEVELDEDTIVRYEVLRNREFTSEEFTVIKKQNTLSKMFNKVLNYLKYGIRSEKELRDYLYKEKNITDDEVDTIIERLRSLGYIDDANYVKEIIDYYKHSKGINHIINYLSTKGVQSNLNYLVYDLYSYEEEKEVALKVASKYSNQIRKFPLIKQKHLVSSKLLRDGFSSDTIHYVLDHIGYIDESEETLKKDFHKYYDRFSDKGLSEYALKQKITEKLLSIGYSSSRINEMFKNRE